jgi:hypothetical protein
MPKRLSRSPRLIILVRTAFDAFGLCSSRRCLACLDEIQNLQDPVLFYYTVKSDAEARRPQMPPQTGKRKQQRKDPMADSNFIASVISSM